MLGSGCGHGEPVRLLDPAPEQGQQGQGDQRQNEHAAEPERARRQAVHDGDDPGAGAVPCGDERHCLGPVSRGGLLRRGDLRQPVRGAEQRTAAGEDGHEPPVAGAGRGQRGHGQPRADRDEQQPPAAEAVGQASDGKRAQRRQAHDGQSDTQVGARQPGLVGEGCAVVHLAEPPGHVAEGGYDAELPEPRGEGGDSHTGHGPVVPAVQTQPARPRYGDLSPTSRLGGGRAFRRRRHCRRPATGQASPRRTWIHPGWVPRRRAAPGRTRALRWPGVRCGADRRGRSPRIPGSTSPGRACGPR